jgi:hypothetical protein
MTHVLTVKITDLLSNRLKEACIQERTSKGAFVREALENCLKARSASRETTSEKFDRDFFEQTTRDLMRGKKINAHADWDELRRKASVGKSRYKTPEQEVMAFRRRRS